MASPDVVILDSDWPGRALPVMPGDLTQWLRFGDEARTEARTSEDRDLVVPGTGPILASPQSDAGGGMIMFDDRGALERLPSALDLMGVYRKSKDYAVFWGVSLEPEKDRYLHQVRIVTHAALAYAFKARSEAEELSTQPIPLGAYIETFIAEQREKWNDGRRFSAKLDGLMGGDGDSAREKLGFGFAVESSYFGVYRLWSRAWLCTK